MASHINPRGTGTRPGGHGALSCRGDRDPLRAGDAGIGRLPPAHPVPGRATGFAAAGGIDASAAG